MGELERDDSPVSSDSLIVNGILCESECSAKQARQSMAFYSLIYVTDGEGMFAEQGAGDQGMMFGYASNETPELMPATIHYSHRIVEELARRRHSEPAKYSYLRPDSKSQVSIAYENGKPVFCVLDRGARRKSSNLTRYCLAD